MTASTTAITTVAQFWRTIGTASPKGALVCFLEWGTILAESYTSTKQLVNHLEQVEKQYRLNKIFRTLAKHAKASKTVADAYVATCEELGAPKKERAAPKAKPLDIADILGALNHLSPDDIRMIAEQCVGLLENPAPAPAPAPALM
jgi:hypothetical protein